MFHNASPSWKFSNTALLNNPLNRPARRRSRTVEKSKDCFSLQCLVKIIHQRRSDEDCCNLETYRTDSNICWYKRNPHHNRHSMNASKMHYKLADVEGTCGRKRMRRKRAKNEAEDSTKALFPFT